MILFDEAGGQGVEVIDAGDADAADTDASDAAASAHEQAAWDEVEEWLDAVALCFNLPEGRRWIDPERLLRDS